MQGAADIWEKYAVLMQLKVGFQCERRQMMISVSHERTLLRYWR